MPSRSRYWSCSKFADWLRGTPKPGAATLEGWHAWRKTAKASHRFRFWLAEEGLDHIQSLIHWPTDKLYDIKYWYNNRFTTKTHALTSTSLEKGKWHELDTRILHCLFDELVEYVEVEQAWFNVAWDKEARIKYNAPFHATGWFRLRTWRCPEAGLDALKWAADLVNEDGSLTHQSHGAREILALYDWWKTVYSNRIDPHEASGWSAYCEDRRVGEEADDEGLNLFSSTEESKEILDRLHEIERQYAEEEEDMLIRLIKIRSVMWT